MNLDPYDRGCVHNKSHAATKGSVSTVILNDTTRSPVEALTNAAGDDFVADLSSDWNWAWLNLFGPHHAAAANHMSQHSELHDSKSHNGSC